MTNLNGSLKVIIIEDEPLAQARLVSMLREIDPSIHVLATLATVKESVDFLSRNPAPDVAFVDIQLADDHSFEIFRLHPPAFPLVFTTAYDKYLLESFEHNAIDYLLKPITKEKLARSLEKLKKLEQHFIRGNIAALLQGTSKSKHVIAKKGTGFVALPWHDIAYFFTIHKTVFIKDQQDRQFLTDRNLTAFEGDADPNTFFRINRKYLVNVVAIDSFTPENGKILIRLRPSAGEPVYVSKETAPSFRKWIGAQ